MPREEDQEDVVGEAVEAALDTDGDEDGQVNLLESHANQVGAMHQMMKSDKI